MAGQGKGVHLLTSREWDAVPLSAFLSLQIKDIPKLDSLSAAHVTSGKQSLLVFLFFFFFLSFSGKRSSPSPKSLITSY